MGKMDKHMKNKKGFTLIEVVVSLVLIGILVVVAGLGLVQIVNGYVLAKQNSETIQKVQIAMARIGKELGAANSISTAAATSITYTRPNSPTDLTPVTNTLEFVNSEVRIGISSINPRPTLINNVTAFSLAYYDAAGNATATPANIRRVNINLTITGVGTPFTNSFAIVESYL